MGDRSGWPELLIGIERARVLGVTRDRAVVTVTIETTDAHTSCAKCGVRAVVKDRSNVEFVDLPVCGTPSRLVWRKRRWECLNRGCDAPSATEIRADIARPRTAMTHRAAVWATIAVGRQVRPVSHIAAELGVAWATVMETVRIYAEHLIDDPDRVTGIHALGVDETKFVAGNSDRSTSWVTAVCDVGRCFVADVVEHRDVEAVTGWATTQPAAVTSGVGVVVSDMSHAYTKALRAVFPDAVHVVDRFGVVQAANRTVDETRRRVQTETFGHRGRKHDPLYRGRKLVLVGEERLTSKGRHETR